MIINTLDVPHGLEQMLQDFVIRVLRKQPKDLVGFAREYFAALTDIGMRNELYDTDDSGKEFSDEEGDDDSDDSDDSDDGRKLTRRESVIGDMYDPETDLVDDEKVVYPKTEEQKARLKEIVATKVLLGELDGEQVIYIMDAMREMPVKAGDRIIEQGDPGDHFYVVERGDFDIFVTNSKTKKQVHKGTYKGQGEFGEVALIYGCRRQATIIAATDGLLWAIDRHTFNRIVLKDMVRKRKQYEDFLSTVPLFRTLTELERARVADVMKTIVYEDGVAIIREGDAPDYFYVVSDGEVIVKRKGADPNEPEKEVELNRYGIGKYFGELALVTDKPRAASAYANGRCSCAVLDVHAFERLLGPCKQLLMRNIPFYEQQLTEVYKKMKLNGQC